MRTAADRIRERRAELGWSERELARRLGCSRGMVQQLEAGRPAWPSLRVRVAVVLEVPENELFAPDAPNGHERSSADLLAVATMAIEELVDRDEPPDA